MTQQNKQIVVKTLMNTFVANDDGRAQEYEAIIERVFGRRDKAGEKDGQSEDLILARAGIVRKLECIYIKENGSMVGLDLNFPSAVSDEVLFQAIAKFEGKAIGWRLFDISLEELY